MPKRPGTGSLENDAPDMAKPSSALFAQQLPIVTRRLGGRRHADSCEAFGDGPTDFVGGAQAFPRPATLHRGLPVFRIHEVNRPQPIEDGDRT